MFDSAKLKIERAKHHIRDLNGQVDAYSAQRPLGIFHSFDSKASQVTYEVKAKIPMPDEIPLILGDAIHNLRSALDLLIYEMVGDKCETDRQRKQVQFPFSKSAQILDATIKAKQVHLAGEKVVQKIKGLKPYPGGNEMLYGIHALDVTDKHKLIIPISGNAGLASTDLIKAMPEMPVDSKEGVTLILAEGVQFKFNVPRPQGSRRARRAARSTTTPEKETDFKPTSSVCFGEDQPFPMQPVIAILDALAKETEHVIDVISDAAR